MSYKITINNPGQHICNPLLTLDGRKYATREEACEEIYEAMYDVIDGEHGCEMVERPDACNGDDDESANDALSHYIADCHAFILSRGYATEDGVDASVEEVADGHLWHCTREGITGDVDFVAVDGDGNVLGYYRFKPVQIEE